MRNGCSCDAQREVYDCKSAEAHESGTDASVTCRGATGEIYYFCKSVQHRPVPSIQLLLTEAWTVLKL